MTPLKLAEQRPAEVSVQSLANILQQLGDLAHSAALLAAALAADGKGGIALEPIQNELPLKAETDANKLAMQLQAPVKSRQQIKLAALINELHAVGIGYGELQHQLRRMTKKSERAQLSDDECAVVAVEFDGWLQQIKGGKESA